MILLLLATLVLLLWLFNSVAKSIQVSKFENELLRWVRSQGANESRKARESLARGEEELKQFTRSLLDLAQNRPIEFLSEYYSIFETGGYVGSTESTLYTFSAKLPTGREFPSPVEHINLNLLNICRDKITRLGNAKLKSIVMEALTPTFKSIFLKSINRNLVIEKFKTGDLKLDDFKTYRRYWRYKNWVYYDYGPFSWLRNAGVIDPKKIRATIRKSSPQKSTSRNLRSNIAEPTGLKHFSSIEQVNEHIDKIRKSSQSRQPFVTRGERPTTLARKEVRYLQTFRPGVRGVTASTNPTNASKSRGSRTSVYILTSPFKAESGIEIKVGESTNLRARIDSYRQYWRNKFSVVNVFNAVVEDELKLKTALARYHTSNEFFTVPHKVLSILSSSRNQSVESVIEDLENV